MKRFMRACEARLLVRALVVALVLFLPAWAGCAAFGGEREPQPLVLDLFLWRSPAELVVEIDFMPGLAPTLGATEHLRGVLENVTAKRHVTLDIAELSNVTSDRQHRWTYEEIFALESRSFRGDPSWRSGGERAFMHVLYLDGGAPDDNEIGRAFGDFAVVYANRTRTDVLAHPGPRLVESQETRTLTHEVGHLLGLVNDGVPMVHPHSSAQSPHHSSNAKSVMYATGDMRPQAQADLGVDPLPVDFDADDLADLAAERARDPAAR